MMLRGVDGAPVIGLTGGMGSGKSAVADFLRKRWDGIYIDADEVCRELLVPGRAGWRSFKESFGTKFLHPDESVNRALLRQVIFRDEEARLRLNRLLHPLAREEMVKRVAGAVRPRWFLLEVPLLYEVGWDREVDRVVVVYASSDRCLERVMRRDRIPREEAKLALASQWPLESKARLADHVVDNSGPWPFTMLQLLHLGRLLGPNFQAGEGKAEKND